MVLVLVGVTTYLLIGIVFLIVFDILTGRVRGRLKEASCDTQKRLVVAGSLVGVKTALVLTLFATWILWPAVVYGAIESKIRGGKE